MVKVLEYSIDPYFGYDQVKLLLLDHQERFWYEFKKCRPLNNMSSQIWWPNDYLNFYKIELTSISGVAQTRDLWWISDNWGRSKLKVWNRLTFYMYIKKKNIFLCDLTLRKLIIKSLFRKDKE